MDLDHAAHADEVDANFPAVANSNVQVVVRTRPPNSREKEQGYAKCVEVDSSGKSLQLTLRPSPKLFTFDYVADEAIGQDEMFAIVGKPITDACLQGYHCCLIAYGQTGAGKTFTMQGPDDDNEDGQSSSPSTPSSEMRGLIPRVLEYIFKKIDAEKEEGSANIQYVVKCSYLQIYNEAVSDLLDPDSINLNVREDRHRGMYVEGLQEVVVPSAEATYNVFRRGSLNRRVGMTAMNMESSRSHSVFTIVLESQCRNVGGMLNRKTSRFYLVDLAGSERQKHSEAVGVRLKEAGSINRSLSALGNVIKALVDNGEGRIRHVPYRDSKLTFLLKDALGGNSKCTLVANISPAEKNVEETLSTLKFAQRAKLMRNMATVNEDVYGNPEVMGAEIRRMRLEIAALRAMVDGGVNTDPVMLTGPDLPTDNERISRLEHIISQSTKKSLAAERKLTEELKALRMQLDGARSSTARLEHSLMCHKMLIKLRDDELRRLKAGQSAAPEVFAEEVQQEMDILRKQVQIHPDVVKFKMELDICKARLEELEDSQNPDDALQAQLVELESLYSAVSQENEALKVERDERVSQLGTANEELASVRDLLTAESAKATEMRGKLEIAQIENSGLHARVKKLEEKLNHTAQENIEVRQKYDQCQVQITELGQQLRDRTNQYDVMLAASKQQEKFMDDCFQALQKESAARAEAIEAAKESESKANVISAELATASQLKAELEAAVALKEETIKGLQEAVSGKAAAIAEANTKMEMLEAEVQGMKTTVALKEDVVQRFQVANEDLEKRLLSLTQQMEDQTARVEDAVAAAAAAKAEKEALQADLDKAQAEIARLESEIRGLVQSVEEFKEEGKGMLERALKAEGLVEEHKQKTLSLEQDVTVLSEEVAKLQSDLEQARKTEEELAASLGSEALLKQAAIDELEAHRAEKEKIAKELQLSAMEVDGLRKELVQSQAGAAALKDERDRVAALHQEAEGQLAIATGKFDELAAELQQVKNAASKLEGKLHESQSCCASLKEQLTSVTQENEDMQGKIVGLENELAKSGAESVALRAEVERLVAEKRVAEDKFEEAQRQVRDAETRFDEVSADLAKALEREEASAAKEQELRLEVEQLNAKVVEAAESINVANENVDRLERENEVAAKALREREAEAVSFRNKWREAEDDYKATEHELRTTESELGAQITGLSCQRDALEEQLAGLQQRLAEAHGYSEELECEVSAAREERDRLSSDLFEAQRSISFNISAMQAAAKEGAEVDEELAALKGRLAEVDARLLLSQGESEQLRVDLEKSRTHAADVEGRLGDRFAELLKEASEREAEKEEMTRQLQAAQEEAERVHKELAEKEEQVAGAMGRLAETASAHSRLEEEHKRLAEEAEAKEKSLKESQQRVEALDKEMVEARTEKERVETLLKASQAEADHLHEVITAKDDEIAAALERAALAEAAQQATEESMGLVAENLRRKERSAQEAHAAAASLGKELAEAKEKLAEGSAELRALRVDKGQLQALLRSKEEQATELRGLFESQRARVIELEETLLAAREEAAQERQKLQQHKAQSAAAAEELESVKSGAKAQGEQLQALEVEMKQLQLEKRRLAKAAEKMAVDRDEAKAQAARLQEKLLAEESKNERYESSIKSIKAHMAQSPADKLKKLAMEGPRYPLGALQGNADIEAQRSSPTKSYFLRSSRQKLEYEGLGDGDTLKRSRLA